MRAIGDGWPARLNYGARELLLFAPGFYFGISNFVQHAAALGGFKTGLHAVSSLGFLMAAFSLVAVAPLTARHLRTGKLAARPFVRFAAHLPIIVIAAPIQFFAIACAVVFIREPVFAVSEVVRLHADLLSECVPIWIAVYALLVAIDTRLGHRQQPPRPHERPTVQRETGRLCFHADGADHLLDPDDISHVRALGDYVQIHAGGRRLTVKTTMAEVEASLAQRGFIRVHRSAIVRAAAIASLQRNDSGAYDLRLDNGDAVPLSRRRLGDVRAAIGTRS